METSVEKYTNAEDANYGTLTNVYGVNWSNKNVEYIVRSSPTPTNASYPEVDWTLTLNAKEFVLAEDTTYEDYITITEMTDSYVRFKIANTFDSTADDLKPVYITFSASAQAYKGGAKPITSELNVLLRSYEAPARIRITQKQYNEHDVPSITEVIYHYAQQSTDNKFSLDFYKVKDAGSGEYVPHTDTLTQAVTWSLTDQNGNAVDLTDPNVVLTLGTPVNAVGEHSITVTPYHTTPGETYVTLTATSLYDSTVTDSITLKVQLYTEKLEFSQETLRLAVNSSKDLASYVRSAPQDVYVQELNWSIVGYPTEDPDNLNAVMTEQRLDEKPEDFHYANLGTGTTASTIYTYEWATPLSPVVQYIKIKVWDSYNTDAVAYLNVAIMDLDAPFQIDDVEVENALGDMYDTVTINKGLEVGDTLIIYAKYSEYENTNSKKLTITLTNTMVVNGAGKFSVSGLLDSSGDELGLQLWRKADPSASEQTAFTCVPVAYGSEPSEVKGYVRLFGKDSSSSAQAGIRIDLVGTNYSETVYTKENGFFRFTKYIAPGYYKMTISKTNYLTRIIDADSTQGYLGLKIDAAEEFYISTEKNPIYLYPGDVNNDGTVDILDVTYYVSNWVGQTNPGLTGFDSFNFDDTGSLVINSQDLALVLMRKDWARKSYPVWNVPKQS